MADRNNLVIGLLVLVIVVLGGILLFTMVIKPKLSGYVVAKQTEGVQIAVSVLLTQLQQNGFVQVPIPGGNQYVLLVPAQQQPGLEQQAQPEAPATQ